MKQSVQRVLLFLLLITASIIAAVAAEKPAIFDIRISERQVQGENNLIRVNLGDEVVLNWQTDETVSIHLHGYDIEKTIVAGETASMAFTAHATGRYPVTSHGFANQHDDHGHQALMYLEVYPD
jgi:hypothetical protein